MTHRHVAAALIAAGVLFLFMAVGWRPSIILVGSGYLLLLLGWLKPESGPYGDYKHRFDSSNLSKAATAGCET